jgi:hypothetical protein
MILESCGAGHGCTRCFPKRRGNFALRLDDSSSLSLAKTSVFRLSESDVEHSESRSSGSNGRAPLLSLTNLAPAFIQRDVRDVRSTFSKQVMKRVSKCQSVLILVAMLT